jgi:hypothetical protein
LLCKQHHEEVDAPDGGRKYSTDVTITLEAYQQADREFTQREAHSGLRVRGVVTVLLWALAPPVDFMTPCR